MSYSLNEYHIMWITGIFLINNIKGSTKIEICRYLSSSSNMLSIAHQISAPELEISFSFPHHKFKADFKYSNWTMWNYFHLTIKTSQELPRTQLILGMQMTSLHGKDPWPDCWIVASGASLLVKKSLYILLVPWSYSLKTKLSNY